jgi:hypothetical protein
MRQPNVTVECIVPSAHTVLNFNERRANAVMWCVLSTSLLQTGGLLTSRFGQELGEHGPCRSL